MSLRVLVVSQYFWPENFRINELTAELVRHGNSVTVLTGKPNYPDGAIFADYRARPQEFARFHGAEILRVPMWPRGRNGFSLMLNYLTFALSASVVGSWRLRRRQFDVLFVFEPSPVTVGLPAIVLRRFKRAPLLFWVLDQWPETLLAVGALNSRFMLQVVGRLVSFIYDRCDVLLAQSRSLVPLVRRYTKPAERVVYFPNWSEPVAEGEWVVPASEVPAKEGHFDVMFAGNIGDSQDFGAILEAAQVLREHANIRWLVVGDGRMAPWVRTEIQRRGLQSSFVMLGRFPPERMPSFFRHADALLVTLRAEPVFALTVPGKLQSYLAAGIPIIGMLNGEGRQIIEDSRSGFACEAGDSAGLAQAILKLAGLDTKERAAMAARGRDYAQQEFNRDRLIMGLEARMQALVTSNESNGHSLPKWGK